MKKVDLSSLNIEDYVNSIDIKKIKDTLSDSKYKRIIDRIEFLIKMDLNTIRKYLNITNYYSSDEKKEIEVEQGLIYVVPAWQWLLNLQ